jgi:hypothetical protein
MRWFAQARSRDEGTGVAVWMYGAFCASLGLTVAVLAVSGTDRPSMIMALRLTARLSFVFFWPAYVGRAIAIQFGGRFGVFARHGREFGLAYASAQLVHFGLVVWSIRISHRTAVEGVMPFFAIGIVWTYVLALFSVDRIRNALGPGFSRILHTIGLEYIALVFFTDFVLAPSREVMENPIAYLPFSILIIVGFILRMTAIFLRPGREAGIAIFPTSSD